MEKTNKELLVALLDLKKLHGLRLKKKLKGLKEDKQLWSIYSSMVETISIEVEVLSTVVNSEEKYNES